MMKIAYLSVYRDGTGYANAALGNILACEAAGLDVVCRPVSLSAPKSNASCPVQHLEDKDLKGLIKQLAGKEGSRFHGRSISAIAGIILGEALEKELEKEETAKT